jgi:hypothetical protein
MSESQNHPPRKHVDEPGTRGQFDWRQPSAWAIVAAAALVVAAAVLLAV